MTGRLLTLALLWCGLALSQTAGIWVIGGGEGSGGGGDITEAEVAAAIQTGQWIAVDGGSGTDAYTGTTTPCIEAIGTRLLVLFRPDVDNTGASTLTITGCSGDLGPYPIYDGEDSQATSDGQLKAGIDKWLTFCPTCNSASGAWIGNFAATPPSATWGAIGGTLSDQTDLNDALAAASIDNLGATAPVTRTGDDFGCATCVVEDGSGNVHVTGDLTVDGDVIAGGGGALIFELTWMAGLNIGGSPSSGFSLPAANAPAVTAETGGTNSVQNAFFQFDDTTDESVYFSFVLPSDWTGAIDGKVYWRGVATTGEVTWGWQLACTDDAETLTQALNTASVVADTAKGTTLQMNEAVETGITATGCSAGDIIQGRFFRDANASESGADDDFSGDAFFYSMTLTIRRQL